MARSVAFVAVGVAAVSAAQLPSCTSDDDYGWPRFTSQAELEGDKGWSAYFRSVYGQLPAEYPVCVYDFYHLSKPAYVAAGLNGSRVVVHDPKAVKEGDLFDLNGGYGIYHSKWEPAPYDTWVEVAHAAVPTELEGYWVWNARGSGVFYNTGRTLVFPTPADPAKAHEEAIAFLTKGCSKQPAYAWPRFESDVFGFCAREKGYDSVQFQPQDGQVPTGTFGLTGLTEMVLVNIDGKYSCGTADPKATPLRQGWQGSSQCNCVNEPMAPTCGLMPYPPYPMNITGSDPPMCAAQAKNLSVACNLAACQQSSCSPNAV